MRFLNIADKRKINKQKAGYIIPNYKQINRIILLLSCCIFLFVSCKKEADMSAECKLLTFGFQKSDNPSLLLDIQVVLSKKEITVNVPEGTDAGALKASFTSSPKSTVRVGTQAQVSHITVNDYTNPVTYTVMAEDGSSSDYKITVIKTAILESVAPLIKSKWMTFTYPYNAYFPYNSSSKNSINGHEGNACGPTALAKIFHYMKYPVNGVGKIDYNETIPVSLHWVCDLTVLNLSYSKMPVLLSSSDPESTYGDVARLFLATAAVGHKLVIWNRDASPALVTGLVQYFDLDPGLRLVNRWEVSREVWITLLKTELSEGRPVMIAGRTTTSPAPWESGSSQGHWFNVDGYNAQGEFHVLYNFNNTEGYYDADNLGGTYISYNQAIVGFKAKQ